MLEAQNEHNLRQKPLDGERIVLSESHGFARVSGENLTADLLGDRPNLIDEIGLVVQTRRLTDYELQGVMFSTEIGSAFIKYSTRSNTPGETFLGLSATDSSFTSHGAREIGRSTYTALDNDRGYIQRKPCGLRETNLPFNLTVPRPDFETLQQNYGEDEDIAQRFIEEAKRGERGPITMHLEENWAVFNGMLASFARTELTNGVRFAQLYKRVWGEYPTGQIPVGVHKVEDVLMPDGTVKPILDLISTRLKEKPLELSTMKTRLLSHELERQKAQGATEPMAIEELVKLKTELDAKPIEYVAKRFLGEDPFVQVEYHVPSFARLSFRHILANADRYDVVKQMAKSGFGKNGEFKVAKELYDSVIGELVSVGGQDRSPINSPEESPYLDRVKAGESYQTVFEDWRRQIGALNTDLFSRIAESEVSKMSKSTATVNAVGAAFGNPVWRSNMVGGSPCDWDHLADGQPEFLPQATEPYDFNPSKYQQAVREQQIHIEDDIDALCYLLGIEAATTYKAKYRQNYPNDLETARRLLVDTGDSDLDPNLRTELLAISKQD